MIQPSRPGKALLALLIFFACSVATAQSANPPGQKQGSSDRTHGLATNPLNPFPGAAGSYWVYEGLVLYQPPNNAPPRREKVRWRMSIARVLHRDGATALILRGFPGDLNWSDGNVLPSESMFVQTDDGDYYQIESESKSLVQEFTDTRVDVEPLLDKGELWFRWPITEGAQPGGGNCPERGDQMYCWVLRKARGVSLGDVKGASTSAGTVYSLDYRTMPDNIHIELASGVGIVEYEYHHHGTVADTVLHLVEVHLAEGK